MTEANNKNENNLIEETYKQLEYYSVLDIIAKFCNSDLGRDIILKSRPDPNLFWLRKEHDLINEMYQLLVTDESLPFEGISDVRALLYKSQVSNSILNSNEILNVLDFIRLSRLIINFFKSRNEIFPGLYELSTYLNENRLLEKHITDAIDETGAIRDNASKELQQIRREIYEKSARLRSRLNKILQKITDLDIAQEDFITMREGRLVLPVKVESKRQIPGIIHGVSQTGSTVFLEPSEIIEMNNDISILLNDEKKEIYRILQNLTNEIGIESNDFLISLDVIAHLDSLNAKAKYALEFGGIKPDIVDENYISLSHVKHPILVHSKGLKKVIPLSVEFSDEKRGYLISGPNAGGKTVALKSIGLNILMALSGIFPLGECTTNYRNVYTAIGDHQSIENDLSTFSSQILQLKNILDFCSSESLVLIDEIGSGTDPQEGSALASGVLDSFINIHLFFVATTHQSSLKSYALIHSEIENASLEFDENKLKPTYRFMSGIPGNSYAFVLAENLGISSLVLERARGYIGSRQTELEESIRMLQKFRAEAEELKIQTEQEKIKAEKVRKDFEQRYIDIRNRRQQFIDEAKVMAADIVNGANALIEKTIREIKEEKRSISEIKSDFNTEKKEIQNQLDKIQKQNKGREEYQEFELGDSVLMVESSTEGTVIISYPEDKSALVDFNGLKFKVNYSQLKKSNKKTAPQKSTTEFIKFDGKTSVDLRGMRAEEAIRKVEDFLDNAILSNIQQVTIIHGKGTGALRQVIKELLTKHPSIVNYRTGNITEGGDGVTVVEL